MHKEAIRTQKHIHRQIQWGSSTGGRKKSRTHIVGTAKWLCQLVRTCQIKIWKAPRHVLTKGACLTRKMLTAMKPLLFILTVLFVFSCDLNRTVDELTVRDHRMIILTSDSQEVKKRNIGGDPCTVKGSCTSVTCGANIECGCDETPKCECSWAVCKCDCEKKGLRIIVDPKAYSVNIYQEYLDNLNSLKDLSNSSDYFENTQIAPIVNAILKSIENNDLNAYMINAEHLYDYVHSIQNENAKSEINEWFASRNILDKL